MRRQALRASRSTARRPGARSKPGSRRPARNPPPVAPEPAWPFNIIYSSGTTGEPKGIVQGHGMRWAHVRRGAKYGYGPQTVTLLSTPLYSNTTLVVFFPTIAFGGCVILMPKFDAAGYLKLAEKHRVTHTMLVPVQYQRLMAHPAFDAHDLSRFRFKFSTSAPFNAALKADVLKRWPGGLIEFYGMTEGGGTCILEAHLHPDKLHTVGQPAEGSDIRLIDESGHEVARGEAGEVVGHSAGMMVGYHRQPEKTREAEWFDPTGKRFIRTGDVGRFDDDGFLTLLRPQEGHDHQRRLQHLPERPRGGAARRTPRWPMSRWSACLPSNGARRRWPSWCGAPATTPAPTRCCNGPTPSSARRSGSRACSSSTSFRAARSARCSSASCVSATPRTELAPAHGGGGNGLLWVLLVVAAGFAIAAPRAPMDYVRLIDWQTIGALAGLLVITQGVEQSGMLQSAAARLLSRTTELRTLVFLLTASAALLSALVTNDVSLFLLVPLTRVLAAQAHLPLARLVVLEALAVNAGSALTPIGNPQNLFLWHRSGESFVGFMGMMAPTVALMLFWLFLAIRFLVPRAPILLKPAGDAAPMQPRLLVLSGLLFVGFVIALDRHWLAAGLAVVLGAFLLLRPRVLLGVDWALLAIIALMFVDLRQLAELPAVASLLGQWPIAEGWRAYLAAIVASQFISNVPAAILLERYVHDLPALAAGVSVGGFGCVLGSLANLIALRLAKVPHGLREFHRISIPFLLVCAASALLLRLG